MICHYNRCCGILRGRRRSHDLATRADVAVTVSGRFGSEDESLADRCRAVRYRTLSGWFFRRRKPENLRPWEVGIPAPFKRHISIEVFEWFSAVAKRSEPALEHQAVQKSRRGGKRFKPLESIHPPLEVAVVALNEVVGARNAESLFPHCLESEKIIPSFPKRYKNFTV